jgi:hypothetical protein
VNLLRTVLLNLNLFGPLVENDADIFTKNVSHDLYVKQTKNVLADAGNFSPG